MAVSKFVQQGLARAHFLEAIAHSECTEGCLIRAALVEGLPAHHARRKAFGGDREVGSERTSIS